MDKGLILFSFLVLSIFDSFSQITGQLLGRKKIFPKISPDKTVEGLFGGALIALFTALLIKGLISLLPLKAMLLSVGIVIFAFIGDIFTSKCKKMQKNEDYLKRRKHPEYAQCN
jgi:phosphatidate cytidylyltransferase